jgi:NAD(P)H-dependent FMN reductase
MADRPILIISGTNRPGANALRIAKILEAFYAKAGVATSSLSLESLPAEMFLPASYAAKPQAVKELQQRILDAAGLHLVVPEYNGSFPGVLKYFIDMLKFPESFEHKPVAYVGESAGIWGGLRAVEQLQLIFAYRNAHPYPPRVFIPGVGGKLDASGQLTDADLLARLEAQCLGFSKFVKTVSATVPAPL